jgi:hypothetical protein
MINDRTIDKDTIFDYKTSLDDKLGFGRKVAPNFPRIKENIEIISKVSLAEV